VVRVRLSRPFCEVVHCLIVVGTAIVNGWGNEGEGLDYS
jgi:hypothetical protein